MSKKKLAVWAGILLAVIIVIILLLCKQCNGKSDSSETSVTVSDTTVATIEESAPTDAIEEATTASSEEDVLGATKETSETAVSETSVSETTVAEETASETTKKTKKTTSAKETTAAPAEQTTTTVAPAEQTTSSAASTTKETTKATTTSSKPANQDPAGEPDEPAAPHEPKHYTVSLTGHAAHENDESFPMTVNLSEAAEVDTTVNVKVILHDGDTSYGPTDYSVTVSAGSKSGAFSIPNTLGDDILVSDKSMEGYVDSASDSLNNVFNIDSTHHKYFIKDTIDPVTVSLYYYSDEDHVYIGAKMSQPAAGTSVSVKLTSTVLYSLPNIVIPVGETEGELELNYPRERWTVMIQYLNVQPGVYENLSFTEGEYVAGEFRPEGN